MPEGDRPDLPLALWLERHEALLDDARANGTRRSQARLVVLGDSIADGWYASRSFTKQWLKDRPLNLALPGEQTQHLLWRIDQGTLDGLEPRLVVLMVGVFNLIAGFSPEETASGIQALLSRVRSALPGSKVLVVSLLPAGQASGDPLRARIEATNRGLSALAQPNEVVVVDVGGMFIDADGTISPSVMRDFLLPTELGYRALTTALSLVTHQLMMAQ
jgi:lysophospholipase L1-like esterase